MNLPAPRSTATLPAPAVPTRPGWGHLLGQRLRAWRDAVLLQEDLNFLLTNRVPRIALTRLMGWYSRIESPLLTRLSIAVWRAFADLDLGEAEPQRWRSLQQVFTRALKPGLRPVDADPSVLVSPCDAIVGACGVVRGAHLFQAKGLTYRLGELLGGTPAAEAQAARYRGASYVTLRLTSAMYHRFHAPCDGQLTHARYISGDTWNVNPIALKRVQRLFCRNERAVLELATSPTEPPLLLVPVAAILVASLRVHALDAMVSAPGRSQADTTPAGGGSAPLAPPGGVTFNLRWTGPSELPCDAPLQRGQEMGWFEQGSTIIVIAPRGHALCPGIAPGTRLKMGQRLMSLPRR